MVSFISLSSSLSLSLNTYGKRFCVDLNYNLHTQGERKRERERERYVLLRNKNNIHEPVNNVVAVIVS